MSAEPTETRDRILVIIVLIMRIVVVPCEGTQQPVPRREESDRQLRERGSTGLTEAVLQGIRTDVFNVSAPIAP